MAKVVIAAKQSGGKRKVRHIRITSAKNGFTVHHELEHRPSLPGRMIGFDQDPDPSVFTKKKAMMDHVSGLASQMPCGPDDDAQEGDDQGQ